MVYSDDADGTLAPENSADQITLTSAPLAHQALETVAKAVVRGGWHWPLDSMFSILSTVRAIQTCSCNTQYLLAQSCCLLVGNRGCPKNLIFIPSTFDTTNPATRDLE